MKNYPLIDREAFKKYLQEASVKTGIQPALLEKDYWVVWALWILFNQEELKSSLTFKGGTSLSKAYNLIQRFSEDVDLSIEKSFLGIEEPKSPEKALSRKKRAKALKELSLVCQSYVQGKLFPSLKEKFSKYLKSDTPWKLVVDASDPDGQTLVFSYPSQISGSHDYVEKSIKIEMGARSEHWPVSHHKISSYLKAAFSDKIAEPEVEVKVLNVERTFWEKATILHQYANIPENKGLPLRLSRHYYDFFKLLKSPVKVDALDNRELLDRVAQHKEIYFHSNWADYPSAKQGTLRLSPPQRIASELERDYGLMKDMFFEDPPKWGEIVESIETFEKEFNS